MVSVIEQGKSYTWSRTFTAEDVNDFCAISGDFGEHHILPDEQGHLIVQGLLTATLPSKIGGDINFIASDMHFYFQRPVYTGDTITCHVTLDELEYKGEKTRVRCSWTCTNQANLIVMTGDSTGFVRKGTDQPHL